MESRRLAPTLGIGASLSVVALLLVPYAILGAGDAGTYYAAGAVTPWFSALLALVAVVVFAAGREDRTAPETAAGIGLGLGFALAVVAVLWAVTVPGEVPLQLTTDQTLFGPVSTADVLQPHRWVVALTAATVPACGVWYARTLDLLYSRR
jgi:hypothetical protein